ncbi:MAG: type II secretion system protein [Elusimicrobiota bacterium]|jgi:type II secretory pathway pseudopilin PulG
MTKKQSGTTLTELMIGIAIMGTVTIAFATMLRQIIKATTSAQSGGEAQEEVRQALMKAEADLLHADEITLTSATLVEFIVDLDQSPDYAPNGDIDNDGIPNYRDGDRDNDSQLLMPATAQWQIGNNLKDDDEDGDGQIDVRERLYLSGGSLWLDTSVNEEAWGLRTKCIMANVSAFTMTYWGNKSNALGRNIDLNNDGIISANEMDMTAAPNGMGNQNGSLDTKNERRYITSIGIKLGSDKNRDGKTDYAVETDIYPPLLPLKSR